MGRSIAVFIIILSLVGCVPSLGVMTKQEKKTYRQKKRCIKRYDRYKKFCPQSVQIDSVRVDVPVRIDSQTVSKSFAVQKDTTVVDTLLFKYKTIIDRLAGDNDSLANVLLRSLGRDFTTIIKNTRCIQDSISFDTTLLIIIDQTPVTIKITIGATQPDANTITPFIELPSQQAMGQIIYPDEKICPPKLSIKERLWELWKSIWLTLIITLIGLGLLITFRKTIKNFIR